MSSMNEPKVIAWKESLSASDCTLHDLQPLCELDRRNGELLFGLYKATATDKNGEPLLPYVLIRGHACVVVPLLINIDTGEERFLMIRQRRIGNGHLSLEFPAGMLDRQLHGPALVALQELHEETGLEVSPGNIFLLNNKLLYSSAGLTDEGIYYYGTIKNLTNSEFCSFEGRLTGKRNEGERIKVTLCTRKQAEAETTSLQTRLAFYLFDDYRKTV